MIDECVYKSDDPYIVQYITWCGITTRDNYMYLHCNHSDW